MDPHKNPQLVRLEEARMLDPKDWVVYGAIADLLEEMGCPGAAKPYREICLKGGVGLTKTAAATFFDSSSMRRVVNRSVWMGRLTLSDDVGHTYEYVVPCLGRFALWKAPEGGWSGNQALLSVAAATFHNSYDAAVKRLVEREKEFMARRWGGAWRVERALLDQHSRRVEAFYLGNGGAEALYGHHRYGMWSVPGKAAGL